jgi:gas vesicle protein
MSSNNANSFFAFVTGMVIGAVGGALIALLYAPMSGQEMRTEVRTRAQAEYDRAVVEYHKQLERLNQELDTIRAQLSQQDEQIEALAEAAEEESA